MRAKLLDICVCYSIVLIAADSRSAVHGLQVFGLLDMHQQLDSQLESLAGVLASTNSGNVLKVRPVLTSHFAC